LSSGPNTSTSERKQEPRDRDSEKWAAPDDSTGGFTNVTSRVTKAPEDLKIFPQEMDLFPQEVNADEDEWTDTSLKVIDDVDLFYWSNVSDPL